jgi:membrane protease YdiL (CAAX protease family)
VTRGGEVVAAVALLAVLGALAATAAGSPEQGPWIWPVWVAAAAFLAQLLPSVSLGLRAVIAARPWLRLWLPAALVAVGVVAAAGSGSVTPWRIIAWALCVAAAVRVVGRDAGLEYSGWTLLAGALVLALAAGAWDRALRIAVPGGTRLGFTFLTAVALALFLYQSVRPLRSLDVGIALAPRHLGQALGAFAAAGAVAIPLGYAVGFIGFNPRWSGPGDAAARLLGLTLFVALPEELLFRGLIQEGLTRLRGPRTGWIAASVVFGLTHITKSTGLPPAGDALGLNWRYALLATIAGLAYGWVYQRTRKVSAAAVTHGVTNWVWSGWFGS